MEGVETMSKLAKIINRVNPCRCGCRGGDSWHARTFKRVVKGIEILEVPRRVTTRAFGDSLALRVGVARFPFGERVVVEAAVEWLDRDALERGEIVWKTFTRRDGTLATLGWCVTDKEP